MGRASRLLANVQVQQEEAVEAEVEVMSTRPDEIPEDVWQLIQENGRIATERLNEILTSPKFLRLRAGDQAKLIALAQNRAYGNPKNNTSKDTKRRAGSSDVTQHALNELVHRATLPEYKLSKVEDAEILDE